jgi:putative nucleotidyltransferase with HDIG domain
MIEPARILVVDDDEGVRNVLVGGCSAWGYEVDEADSAETARRVFAEGRPYELVFCDIDMPGEKGDSLLRWLRRQDPDVAVVMVTGIAQAETAVSCMHSGAADYVVKPFNLSEVQARAQQVLEKRALVIQNRRYQRNLEGLVRERTHELENALDTIGSLNDDLRSAYDATLSTLMIALDYRDNETQGHSVRVVEYVDHLARVMGLGEPDLSDIRRGTMLHDVGKIGIPDAILRKPGPLVDAEWDVMQLHADLGYRMLRDIPFLQHAAEIVLAHQEKWDGSGYPRGLRGERIPLGARIFAVADAFDAMTTDRPYRNALTYEQARQEIIDHCGNQFDPRVVEAFLGVDPAEWRRIRAEVDGLLARRSAAGVPPDLFDRLTHLR